MFQSSSKFFSPGGQNVLIEKIINEFAPRFTPGGKLIPWRFGFWALGLVIDFATPLICSKLQIQLPPHPSHLAERFRLFTMIVLGEAMIAVVDGVSEQK